MQGLGDTAHRPWPPPERPWRIAQRWEGLLFAHWPLAPDDLRTQVPAGMALDTFEGRAWIGIVPFRMAGVRLRPLPPVPGTRSFLELNVRTYVTVGGRPGVLFFSLDADSRLAVATARRTFHLPYLHARMEREALDGDAWAYRCERRDARAAPARFEARYGPTGPPEPAAEGTLEHFLVERYALYVRRRDGLVMRGDIHHDPWPIQPAATTIDVNTMVEGLGLRLPDCTPHLRYARAIDVVAWTPRPAGEAP